MPSAPQTCDTRYRAAHDSGPRHASEIRLIVVHSTEGGNARSVAQFFANGARASTQLVVDDRSCFRCLPDLIVPWGAPGANRHGLHIEHCGFARWTRAEWLAHEPMLERSASRCARWAVRYDIPLRWLTVAELRAGVSGFCRHMDATLAFPPNDGHGDPGNGFPRVLFMDRVRGHVHALTVARGA